MSEERVLNDSFLAKELVKFARKFSLSEREREVFSLLVNKITNSEQIAAKLRVSRNTIRNHFQNIFHKTKTNSKTELLASFIRDVFGCTLDEMAPSFDADLTILYAEDDSSYGDLAKRALSKANIRGKMVLVKDGEEVLDYLYHRGKFAGRDDIVMPDLILLDITMPKKSGFEVLSVLREDEKMQSLPIIALTASDNPADIERLYQAGGNSLIQKPMGFRALVELMRTIVSYWVDAVGIPSLKVPDSASAER